DHGARNADSFLRGREIANTLITLVVARGFDGCAASRSSQRTMDGRYREPRMTRNVGLEQSIIECIGLDRDHVPGFPNPPGGGDGIPADVRPDIDELIRG